MLWAGKQHWSNGAVGMLDGSYSAGTEYLLAPTRAGFFKALFAREGLSDIYRDFTLRGGAYQLALHRGWAIDEAMSALQQDLSTKMAEVRARLEQAAQHTEQWYRYLPLLSCPPLEGIAQWYFDDLRHPEDGPYWWPINLSRHFREPDGPVGHLGGWFAFFPACTLPCSHVLLN